MYYVFQDYMHLRPRNFEYVIRQAEICITRKYITSIFQKKLSLKDERREVADKIIQEAGQIEALLAPASLSRAFSSDAPKVTEDAAKAISALAEVIKCDSEIITLELINFIKKYPDVSQDQLTCLLSLRGDFGRIEARQRVADLLSSGSKDESARSTIFSLITVPSSIFS
jgi:exocyst complex component 3